jgi:hypothetical protein
MEKLYLFSLTLLMLCSWNPSLQAQAPLAELSYNEYLPITPPKKTKKAKTMKKAKGGDRSFYLGTDLEFFMPYIIIPLLISLPMFILGQLFAMPVLWWIGLILIGVISLSWLVLFIAGGAGSSGWFMSGMENMFLLPGSIYAALNAVILIPIGLIFTNSFIWIVGASSLVFALLMLLILLIILKRNTKRNARVSNPSS